MNKILILFVALTLTLSAEAAEVPASFIPVGEGFAGSGTPEGYCNVKLILIKENNGIKNAVVEFSDIRPYGRGWATSSCVEVKVGDTLTFALQSRDTRRVYKIKILEIQDEGVSCRIQ